MLESNLVKASDEWKHCQSLGDEDGMRRQNDLMKRFSREITGIKKQIRRQGKVDYDAYGYEETE